MHASRPRAVVRAVALVLTLLGAACSGADESGDVDAACRRRGDERPAKAILRCREPSVAFVETETGSGTGVVVDLAGKRYVLTNQHVVDPFDAADVVLGKRSLADLPVVGVDAAADIALLGPLDTKRLPAPITISEGLDLERGDDVFLVGYPGESEADGLETTIASGIVSRLRQVKEFEQSYIQTDASIGGGQSGGPLFDSRARLVGISGLSFAEEFALVLTGRDVKEAAQRIVDRKGDEYLSVPAASRDGVGATSGTVRLFDAADGQVLFLPAAEEDRTWHLKVDMAARPLVTVEKTADNEPLAMSSNAAQVEADLARQLADVRGGRPEDIFDPSAQGQDPKLAQRETAPGAFTIPVEADESALVTVWAPYADAPVDVRWESDLPLVAASRPVTEKPLQVGDQADLLFGPFDTAVDILVDLAEGREVQVHARSPQGDPGFVVFPPGVKLDHLTMADPEGAGHESFDDADDGLYGVDAKTTFEAKTAGTYRFRVYSNDYSTVVVRFSVADCAKARCDEKKDRSEKAEDATASR